MAKKHTGHRSKVVEGTSKEDLENQVNDFLKGFDIPKDSDGYPAYPQPQPMGGLRVYFQYPIYEEVEDGE